MCAWKREGKTSAFIWKDNIEINLNDRECKGVGLGCGKVAKVKGKLHAMTGHEGSNGE